VPAKLIDLTGQRFSRLLVLRRAPMTLLASWVSWYLAHGVLPEQNLLHVCDTPACIRPSHLFEGSQADNMYDSAVKAAGGVLVEVPEGRLCG
jgi:hypothetical protein